jgi:hypothetical protein
LLAYEGQPDRIFSSGRKVLAMTLMFHGMLSESLKNRFAVVKILVEIQNEVFRQRQRPFSAPSGLLLRSALA